MNTESSSIETLAAILGSDNAATRLLRHFGGLRAIFNANDANLLSCHGIGRARLTILRALPDFARHYYAESLPVGESIKNPQDTESFLKARMRHLDHELFCCLYLDNRHRVLRFDELFRGTIDGTSVSVSFTEKPYKCKL